MTAIHAIWRRLDRPGHDTARLTRAGSGWVLEGYAAFHEEGPTGVRYTVDLASDFRTLAGLVEGHRAGASFRHHFERAGAGWRLDGRAQQGLDDVLHLDFGFTPATNLAHLMHADLPVGDSAEIEVAWFDLGEGGLTRLPQVYRRIAGDRYRYHAPGSGYEATLDMAASGFVRLYPGLWEMEPGR